jgi:fructan beta-fructosidase
MVKLLPMVRNLLCLMLMWAVASTARAEESKDVVIADFEGETYGDWQVTGEAFGSGPARGTLPNQMHVEGFEGKGLVNSFFHGDKTTGTLTSPEFTVERKFINFLIGGGKHETQTCINLLADGKVVRTATGPNGKPGGTERLDWQAWDVADLAGGKVRVQIVDMATGGWGHINVDQILQSDRKRGSQLVRRELLVATNYLLLPVKNGAAKRQLKFVVDGQTVREFEIELAATGADFTVFSDVRAFRGKTLAVEALLPFDSAALEGIAPSNELPASPPSAEAHRPRFHFTSRRGWLNDPNGLVHYQGEWHLFYQHNPFGWNWGNMHWGHAVSKDLLRWEELPTAIYPKQCGDWAFSGSAVVDAKNMSGFKTGADDVLVAAYTSTGRGECIAFSNDRGRTWTDYERNPVVKHTGRDPKLIWHEPTQRWVMAVYDEHSQDKRAIAFYTSPNLKDWTFASRIDGFYECPDIFPLAVTDPPHIGPHSPPGKAPASVTASIEKWVLYAADGKYLIGNFDGKEFHPDGEKQQVWFGNFYAAQTFSDAPENRRVQIGWANGVTFPGQPFNQQMTIPVELTLHPTREGMRLFAWPVKELDSFGKNREIAVRQSVDQLFLKLGEPTAISAPDTKLDLFDFTSELELNGATLVTFTVCGTPLVYDANAHTLTCKHVKAPVDPIDGRIKLRVIGDRGSLEVFANGGQVAMSIGYTPSETDRAITASSEGNHALLRLPVIVDFGGLNTER